MGIYNDWCTILSKVERSDDGILEAKKQINATVENCQSPNEDYIREIKAERENIFRELDDTNVYNKQGYIVEGTADAEERIENALFEVELISDDE